MLVTKSIIYVHPSSSRVPTIDANWPFGQFVIIGFGVLGPSSRNGLGPSNRIWKLVLNRGKGMIYELSKFLGTGNCTKSANLHHHRRKRHNLDPNMALSGSIIIFSDTINAELDDETHS